jgi:hypothetical protein
VAYINYATCGVEWNAAPEKSGGTEPLLRAQEAIHTKGGERPPRTRKSQAGRIKIARRVWKADRDLVGNLGPVPHKSSAEEPSVSSVASGGLVLCSLGGKVTIESAESKRKRAGVHPGFLQRTLEPPERGGRRKPTTRAGKLVG